LPGSNGIIEHKTIKEIIAFNKLIKFGLSLKFEKQVEISYQMIYNSVMIPIKEKTNFRSIDQALNTEKITPKLVQYIVDKIVREIQPIKIILFGSYARGDFSRDSDLDLFVVVENSEESSRLLRRKIDALLWGRRFPIDLIVRNEKEVERNYRAKNPFYIHHIFKDGKVLYEKGC
jgi:predicted nucleotidyltransferase